MTGDDSLGSCSRYGRAIAISFSPSPDERYAWPCGCRQPSSALEDAD